MYRLYRKMTINGHFPIQSIHFCLDTTCLGSTFKLSYIRNHLTMNHPVKKLQCVRATVSGNNQKIIKILLAIICNMVIFNDT